MQKTPMSTRKSIKQYLDQIQNLQTLDKSSDDREKKKRAIQFIQFIQKTAISTTQSKFITQMNNQLRKYLPKEYLAQMFQKRQKDIQRTIQKQRSRDKTKRDRFRNAWSQAKRKIQKQKYIQQQNKQKQLLNKTANKVIGKK